MQFKNFCFINHFLHVLNPCNVSIYPFKNSSISLKIFYYNGHCIHHDRKCLKTDMSFSVIPSSRLNKGTLSLFLLFHENTLANTLVLNQSIFFLAPYSLIPTSSCLRIRNLFGMVSLFTFWVQFNPSQPLFFICIELLLLKFGTIGDPRARWDCSVKSFSRSLVIPFFIDSLTG